MKKTLLSVIAISLFVIGNAQVVIDYYSHAPIAGDAISFSQAQFVQPGNSGRNITWDFSNVEFLKVYKTSFQFQAGDEDAQKFSIKPTNILEENGTKYFHLLTQNSYTNVGNLNPDFSVDYSQPMTRMMYPFEYSNNYDGNIKAIALYKENMHIDISGTYSITADAYGVMVLPGNVKKNVLRVKQYSKTVEASMCSDIHIESTRYSWYSAEDRYPIMTTIIQEYIYTNGNIVNKEETWINNNVLQQPQVAGIENIQSGNQTQELKFNVFPNPFKESVQITFTLPEASDVSIAVYGIIGNKVSTVQQKIATKAGSYSYNLNDSELNLKPGLYFVRLEVDGKTYTAKIVKN